MTNTVRIEKTSVCHSEAFGIHLLECFPPSNFSHLRATVIEVTLSVHQPFFFCRDVNNKQMIIYQQKKLMVMKIKTRQSRERGQRVTGREARGVMFEYLSLKEMPLSGTLWDILR